MKDQRHPVPTPVTSTARWTWPAWRKLAVKELLPPGKHPGLTRLADGRTLNVLARGPPGQPGRRQRPPGGDHGYVLRRPGAESLEWLVKHQQELETKLYKVPDSIDDQIGRVKLAAMGLAIDTLTPEQEAYLTGWQA